MQDLQQIHVEQGCWWPSYPGNLLVCPLLPKAVASHPKNRLQLNHSTINPNLSYRFF
jgi:hypothetical protein